MPHRLPSDLAARVNRFIDGTDLEALYRAYSWRQDTYPDGFPDILRLEKQLSTRARTEGITLRDVRDVATWGGLRNSARIMGPAVLLKPSEFHGAHGGPRSGMADRLLVPLQALQSRTRGLGPTYLSKVMRFAMPERYGAIDSRCVRVFGQGDPSAIQHNWLGLRARDDGYGWYIPKAQSAWPSDYGLWLAILHYLASNLKISCPHPHAFIEKRLRRKGRWACADVEMALFAYASQFV